MRAAPIGGAVLVLASCTLIVPIDDDLTSGDSGALPSSATDAATDAKSEPTTDGGDAAVGPTREGCPGPADDPDLVGWYPLDEKDGAVAHDCAPGHNDLDALTAKVPVWSAGKIGGAADFVPNGMCFGSKDTKLYAFEDGQPFTVSAWLKIRQFAEPNNSGRWIASHKVSPRGWHFGVDDPDRVELDFEYVVADAGEKTEVSGTTTPNTWVHVLSTYAPGASSTYIDGALSTRLTGERIPARIEAASTTAFKIGCRNTASGGFDGLIDDVRLYKRALTEAEAAALAARAR